MPSRLHPLAPIVALDIDGTLGMYHDHMWRFAQTWTGRELPNPSVEWPDDRKVSFRRVLRMSDPQYNAMKLAYRQGGMKRSMPVRQGAASLVKEIRKAGAQVWLCTTRPYLRLDNVDPDTRHWARRHGITYDGLLYGETKYRDLADIVGVGRVVCCLDDLPEQITAATKVGIDPILADGWHNRYFQHDQRVIDLRNAEFAIMDKITNWKKAHA